MGRPPMNAETLDVIANIIDVALRNGFTALWAFSIPLLALLAVIRYYVGMSEVVMSGGAGLGDAIGTMLWILLAIGVFHWFLLNLPAILDAALNTFVQWGLAPSGGAFSLGDFLLPSRMIRSWWTGAAAIREFISNMGWGKAAPWNWPTLMIFILAFLGIFAGFAVLAAEVMIALFEFGFARLLSAILVPWGVVTQTAFLAELSIAWLVGGLVRMLIMAALMGITVELFGRVALPGDTDPGIAEALISAFLAAFFAGLSLVIPHRASTVAGRGMALGLGAGAVFQPIWRAGMPAAAVPVRAASAMVQHMRNGSGSNGAGPSGGVSQGAGSVQAPRTTGVHS